MSVLDVLLIELWVRIYGQMGNMGWVSCKHLYIFYEREELFLFRVVKNTFEIIVQLIYLVLQ